MEYETAVVYRALLHWTELVQLQPNAEQPTPAQILRLDIEYFVGEMFGRYPIETIIIMQVMSGQLDAVLAAAYAGAVAPLLTAVLNGTA